MSVTVIGNDRPGIVASITKALFEEGCNLEDATSTILRGHFAMMLVVRVPQDLGAPALEGKLDDVGQGLGLVVTVRPVEEAAVEVPSPTHMVAVYGADRPGIVYRVTELLAARGANVTDLTSRVIGSEDEPVYALMLEVELSDPRGAEQDLSRLQDELGIDISVHAIETDVL
jgi:glycine cleavage system transcriptional repressor